jgi:hypothetical protein
MKQKVKEARPKMQKKGGYKYERSWKGLLYLQSVFFYYRMLIG